MHKQHILADKTDLNNLRLSDRKQHILDYSNICLLQIYIFYEKYRPSTLRARWREHHELKSRRTFRLRMQNVNKKLPHNRWIDL